MTIIAHFKKYCHKYKTKAIQNKIISTKIPLKINKKLFTKQPTGKNIIDKGVDICLDHVFPSPCSKQKNKDLLNAADVDIDIILIKQLCLVVKVCRNTSFMIKYTNICGSSQRQPILQLSLSLIQLFWLDPCQYIGITLTKRLGKLKRKWERMSPKRTLNKLGTNKLAEVVWLHIYFILCNIRVN